MYMKKSQFEKRISQVPNSIWAKITQIDELKGRWVVGANLSPQVLTRLKKSVLITSTGASTRIEGAKLSDEEIEKMLRGLSVQKFADRDAEEVRGYFELLQNVFNTWDRLKFSENTIKGFHQDLLKYAHKDERHRGDYKKAENRVEMFDADGRAIAVVFDTTLAYLTPKEMQELVEWTNQALNESEYHPLLIISNFIIEFLKIHPFLDGNGRLSRVLTNLLLLQRDYPYMPYVSHEKLIEDNKTEYYAALRKSQRTFGRENENILSWLEFFLSIMLEQSKIAYNLLSKESVDKLLSPKQLTVWEFMVSVDEATPKKIAEETGVARPTINQVLNKLLKLKRIERFGLGRSTRYRKI